jgi:hypothetical protein
MQIGLKHLIDEELEAYVQESRNFNASLKTTTETNCRPTRPPEGCKRPRQRDSIRGSDRSARLGRLEHQDDPGKPIRAELAASHGGARSLLAGPQPRHLDVRIVDVSGRDRHPLARRGVGIGRGFGTSRL